MSATSFEDLILGKAEREMQDSKARLMRLINASYKAYVENQENQDSPDSHTKLSHAMENLISEVNNQVTKKNILVTLTAAFNAAFNELKATKGEVVHSEGGRKSRRRKKTNRRE